MQSGNMQQLPKSNKPRKGFQLLGIMFLVFAGIYVAMALTSISKSVFWGIFGMAVFMGIVGIMFIVLSRTPKWQKNIGGEKG